MAFLTSAAIVNCFFLLTLVGILFLCTPPGVDASPAKSRHRRTAGVTSGRPESGSLDYVDSWEEALDGEGLDTDRPNEDNDEETANDADSSASGGDHQQRRRELSEPLTSRILREQRRRRRPRHHLAIYALQALTNNLQSRALCGWTYRNNHDMRRIPVDLPEAVCNSTTVAGTRNHCEQVYYNVPIRSLEVSSSGVVSWSAKWLRLQVGCTPAAAGTVPYSAS